MFTTLNDNILTSLQCLLHSGTTIIDPSGQTRRVFPKLFSYVCDFPESAKITATYSAQNSARPCSLCHIGKTELALPNVRTTLRTERHQEDLWKRMQIVSDTEVEALKAEWSCYNVKVSPTLLLCLFVVI
jgi:hypothetical protein